MAEQRFVVPSVDISPYVTDGGNTEGADAAARGRVAAEIDDACRTVGFVQIRGHGVPDHVIGGLADAIDGFFGLPLDVKKGYRCPPEINRGYTPPKAESLSLSLGVESATRMNDYFEAFNVGVPARTYPHLDLPETDYAENVWPAGLDAFADQVGAYFTEAQRVARTLTRIFADALGLPAGFFDAFTDHSLDVLRMNNYALPADTYTGHHDLIAMGEHTDYGIVTVLWADRIAGLQVLDTRGVWQDVCPDEGALLVNLGDLTNRWTNERWLSTLHRVKPPIVDGTIQRRRSAAYFHDGNIDALIATLPTCLAAGEAPRYAPITVAEHIRAKLAGSRAGTPNISAAREAARLAAAVEGSVWLAAAVFLSRVASFPR
ncbi:2-oxoglutarate and iron-dependent oxygenase domain-containing protein [Actinomycetes bacterium KLBMP 9797]